MFNNVKLHHKITFWQSDNAIFKVKMLPLNRLYTYRKPPMGRGWADIHMV